MTNVITYGTYDILEHAYYFGYQNADPHLKALWGLWIERWWIIEMQNKMI